MALTVLLFTLAVAGLAFAVVRGTATKTLRVRLLGGFSVILIILAALAVMMYRSLSTVSEDMEAIAIDDLPILANMADVEAKILEQALVMQRFMNTGDGRMAERFNEYAAVVERELAEVDERIEHAIRTARTRDIRENFKGMESQIKTIEAGYVEFEETARRLVEAEGSHDTNLARELQAMLVEEEEEMIAQCSTFLAGLKASSIEEAEHGHAAARSAEILLIVISLLAVGAGVVISLLLGNGLTTTLKRIVDELSSGSEQVASASEQLASSSQQMSEGASEQASSLEEVSSSLEEMASMTKQNADNARQANTMANDASTAAKQGADAMTRMADAVEKIKGSSDETAKIIKTIDEIAMQTNLLALNAAVEAARAGEAGRGFAVVAEEVRNLAQRSAEAAKNTADLIEGAQQNAENGVSSSEEVRKILEQIIDSVRKVTQLIAEVSAASEEQSQGIDQVNSAVAQMDKVTQGNAANSEEAASASEELSGQAQNLNSMVVELLGIVGGSTGNGKNGTSMRQSGFRLRQGNGRKEHSLSHTVHAALQHHGNGSRGERRGHSDAHKRALVDREVDPEETIPFAEDKELKEF